MNVCWSFSFDAKVMVNGSGLGHALLDWSLSSARHAGLRVVMPSDSSWRRSMGRFTWKLPDLSSWLTPLVSYWPFADLHLIATLRPTLLNN